MTLQRLNPLPLLLATPKMIFNSGKEMLFFSKFILILSIYSVHAVMSMLTCHRWVKPVFKPVCRPMTGVIFRTIALIDRPSPQEIAAVDLVALAYEELKVKKVRTVITIGGMSLGFGLIVFLLSIGYGLERLVISRVANLNEMRQADVLIGQAASLYIDDELVTEISQRESVDAVMPQISIVAKIEYNNSAADAVVYGVTTRYLEESAIQPIEGSIFDDEEYTAFSQPAPDESEATDSGEVAGATIELLSEVASGREVNKVRYAIYPLTWIPVYASPSRRATILGYTNRQPGQQEAVEVWGASYPITPTALQGLDPNEQRYSTWIRDSFPIWEQTACDITNLDCVERSYLVRKEAGRQQVVQGYIMEDQVALERYSIVTDPTAKPGFGARIQTVSYQLPTQGRLPVYLMPSLEAQIEQEVTQVADGANTELTGTLVYGLSYYDDAGLGSVSTEEDGRKLGYWIEATVPLWYQIDCFDDDDCEEIYLPKLDSDQEQSVATVYLRASDVSAILPSPPPSQITNQTSGQVLGESTISNELMQKVLGEISESTESADLGQSTSDPLLESSDVAVLNQATDAAIADFDLESLDDDLEWASIASLAGIIKPRDVEILPTADSLKKIAIVNASFLTMLGLPVENAVGTSFGSTYVLDGKLFGDDDYRAESTPIEYTIVGVLPDSRTPAIYVPLSDLQSFAITRYSQLKVMVKEQNQLQQLRADIEALGFKTNSVVDTVEQINSLFRTLRLALSVVGFVALGVAALGMFNTLTVSLLEKTRQVGLMKAMGMKSHEVKRLFLAESVIMGVAGGLFGLAFAFVAGKLVSGLLTSLAISQGVGVIDVTHIPFTLSAFVLCSSFAMGIVTGWYPSHRATKISALNALRYE